ncbi:HugZ family protein [Mesorhizobium sp. ZMM04-5]|uniref:HugZ family protein n=1 Tax=Mesorhizobium marinum TaxID=3228790 RepID=A0ABV3QTY8_9HYPH
MNDKPATVIRETDADAIRLAKTLVRTARFGSLAVLDPTTGAPLASRVGVATDADGTPLILVSQLAAHTQAILADARCSLLVGEPGKGDPLAHPRIALTCRAARLLPGTPEQERARRRYLNRNPKAKLYVGLGDFSFFRLDVERASLNGGFGKAYLLERDDLIVHGPVTDDVSRAEQGALDHMNDHHADAIAVYARHLAKAEGGDWSMTGIDVEGFDLVSGDQSRRVFFAEPLKDSGSLRAALVEMAKAARSSVREES